MLIELKSNGNVHWMLRFSTSHDLFIDPPVQHFILFFSFSLFLFFPFLHHQSRRSGVGDVVGVGVVVGVVTVVSIQVVVLHFVVFFFWPSIILLQIPHFHQFNSIKFNANLIKSAVPI